MRVSVDPLEHLLKLTGGADQVGVALRVARRRCVEGAEGFSHAPLRVAQELIGEGKLLCEGRVLFGAVAGDPQDDGVLGLVGGVEVAEPATLSRSAGGVRLRVKPQEDALPPQGVRAHLLTVMVSEVEGGCRFSTGRAHR